MAQTAKEFYTRKELQEMAQLTRVPERARVIQDILERERGDSIPVKLLTPGEINSIVAASNGE